MYKGTGADFIARRFVQVQFLRGSADHDYLYRDLMDFLFGDFLSQAARRYILFLALVYLRTGYSSSIESLDAIRYTGSVHNLEFNASANLIRICVI
jgi:hypothetical protein